MRCRRRVILFILLGLGRGVLMILLWRIWILLSMLVCRRSGLILLR